MRLLYAINHLVYIVQKPNYKMYYYIYIYVRGMTLNCIKCVHNIVVQFKVRFSLRNDSVHKRYYLLYILGQYTTRQYCVVTASSVRLYYTVHKYFSIIFAVNLFNIALLNLKKKNPRRTITIIKRKKRNQYRLIHLRHGRHGRFFSWADRGPSWGSGCPAVDPQFVSIKINEYDTITTVIIHDYYMALAAAIKHTVKVDSGL